MRVLKSPVPNLCHLRQRFSFDLDSPACCDDEYWTNADPEKAFKQPPGKPSVLEFFLQEIKLKRILAFALRTLVSCVHLQLPLVSH